MELNIKDCTTEDFRLVAPRLRDEDKQEWALWAGDDPAGLVASGQWSVPSGAGTLTRIGYDASGTPLAVWGVCPIPSSIWKLYAAAGLVTDVTRNSDSKDYGWVWLVATPEAIPVARHMHRHLWPQFDEIKAMYPVLVTASWSANMVHHKWLEWLKFRRTASVQSFYGAEYIGYQHDKR